MDINKIKEIDNECKSAYEYKENLMRTYTKELDDLVEEIKDAIVYNGDFTSLIRYSIELPIKMYELSSKVEDLGLKVDFAEVMKGEKYSRVMINVQGTIPEKQARAQIYVNNEAYAKEIFERCYYSIKGKIDNANQLLISLRALIQSLEKEKNFS